MAVRVLQWHRTLLEMEVLFEPDGLVMVLEAYADRMLYWFDSDLCFLALNNIYMIMAAHQAVLPDEVIEMILGQLSCLEDTDVSYEIIEVLRQISALVDPESSSENPDEV